MLIKIAKVNNYDYEKNKMKKNYSFIIMMTNDRTNTKHQRYLEKKQRAMHRKKLNSTMKRTKKDYKNSS